MAADAGLQRLELSDGQELPLLRLLRQRGDEVGEQHVHTVDLALEEEVLGELRDRASLGEGRDVLVGELGGELALQPGDELRALAAGTDVHGRVLVELGGLAQEVRVQRAAEPLVGADQDDAALLDLALLHQRMAELARSGGRRGQHLVHQQGVGASG